MADTSDSIYSNLMLSYLNQAYTFYKDFSDITVEAIIYTMQNKNQQQISPTIGVWWQWVSVLFLLVM